MGGWILGGYHHTFPLLPLPIVSLVPPGSPSLENGMIVRKKAKIRRSYVVSIDSCKVSGPIMGKNASWQFALGVEATLRLVGGVVDCRDVVIEEKLEIL